MLKRRRGNLAAALACAFALMLLAGCHASATVAVRMKADGSGTAAVSVTVDRAARLALAGAALRPGATTPDVPLDDLRAHGWSVSRWRPSAGGGATIDLSKPFVNEAQLASVLAELDGTDGALRDPRIVRERGLLHDRDGVSVLVDLGHLRAGVAGDAELAKRLRAAGIDVSALDRGLRSRIKESFDLTVRLVLPDGSDTTARFTPGEQHRVAIARATEHTGRRNALVGAAATALLGLAFFVTAALHARRSRR